MAVQGITTQTGVLTSVNTGSYANTGGTGERVLIDYKDVIQDYRLTELPALQMFCEPMSTDTGGNIDLTFSLPSMVMEEIDEGSTPKYQHTKLRSERVSVKEWGLAVGVTRRMLEDSRFNEVEMALNEARKSVERHMTQHVVKMVFGIYDATFNTGLSGADIDENTLETGAAGITDFSTNIYGGFIASGGSVGTGRIYQYGNVDDSLLQASHYVRAASDTAGTVSLADITNAIKLIGATGYNADTLVISPAHYKSLLDLANFQAAIGAAQVGHVVENTQPFDTTVGTGFIGTLYGLNVLVNGYIPQDRFGIFDMSVKPANYVERRALTVEEANPGFGIVGSYMSMRYGLKIVRPDNGVIVINAA